MINLFAVLDPVIKTFIQVVIIIGPLTITGIILLLKRIQNEYRSHYVEVMTKTKSKLKKDWIFR